MRARSVAALLIIVLVLAWLTGGTALLILQTGSRQIVLASIAVAAVALAALLILLAWPRLTGPHEARSPQLVRCPRCHSTFTPPLRASQASCPTCGLVARFPAAGSRR